MKAKPQRFKHLIVLLLALSALVLCMMALVRISSSEDAGLSIARRELSDSNGVAVFVFQNNSKREIWYVAQLGIQVQTDAGWVDYTDARDIGIIKDDILLSLAEGQSAEMRLRIPSQDSIWRAGTQVIRARSSITGSKIFQWFQFFFKKADSHKFTVWSNSQTNSLDVTR